MSCQLNLLASFQDVRSVKRYLFPDQIEEPKKEDNFEGWDDSDWSWKEEGNEADNKESILLSWLQDCHISLSPTGDLLALAKDDRIVHLGQKWDSQDEEIQTKYDKLFEGSITQEDGEKITCVLCLPLASQKRSSHGGPDWTCVVVGFSSGYVRIYTENGTLLLSQIFSEECITQIKCHTYTPPRHEADAERHEELTILYTKSLVTIDGFSFFQSLKACKNQVARATASGSDLLQPPPLAYKKWALLEQEQITNYMPCGPSMPNAFDQMKIDSVNIGFHAILKPNQTSSHLYLTTGVGPYASFFYTTQGGAQPLFSDVAQAVATKLKSALLSAASGWLGLGRSNPENSRDKKRPKIEAATLLPPRFGLYDKRRVGETVISSSNGQLAVTTDSFGRVILIDVSRGVAVRMWKGYRDAQVGWLEAKEEIHQDTEADGGANHLRRSYFLVIYAPRRGILEVWSMQHGPRVAAFSVSKWCRLLCLNYGIMGLNNVTCHDVKVQIHNVYLVDLDGSVKTISVPFHLALSDKNSKRARDLHLLKQLKIVLKENMSESGALQSDVIDTLLDIKTANIRQQGLERLLHTKYLSGGFLQSVINAISQHMETLANIESTVECVDFESRMLLQFCHFHQLLIATFETVNRLVTCSSDEKKTNVSRCYDDETQVMAKLLLLSPSESETVISTVKKYHALIDSETHVQFKSDLSLTVIEFVSCFECHVAKLTNEATEQANFLFGIGLKGFKNEDYCQIFSTSAIPSDNLMNLLLHLWLSSDRRTLNEVPALHSLLLNVINLGATEDVCVWWNAYRDACLQSHNISSSLMLALVGRSIIGTQNENAMQSSAGTDKSRSSDNLSDWESVTLDREQWSVLVKQLEDLLVLQCLLKMKPAHEGLSKSSSGSPEPTPVSLKRVMDGGKGVIPEFVAKWISGYGIPPYLLCPAEESVQSNASYESATTTTSVSQKTMLIQQQNKRTLFFKSKSMSLSCSPIIAQMQDVQHCFPHTLTSDVLMANCSWEFMVIWNRDPEVIFPLDQGIAYLKCIQNAVLQHGIGTMIWQMFAVKKLSSAALLTEKVGKAPKDRLCRKDVGLSEVSLEKFLGRSVELLEIIIQASADSHEVPVFKVEDLWQAIQGPTSLVELAIEQKEANAELVEHHYALCVILHAILAISMKAVKPLSMFDTKGKNAFFKPLHSVPLLSYRVSDESIINARRQFLCRIITSSVVAMGDRPSSATTTVSSASSSPASPPSSLGLGMVLHLQSSNYSRWPTLALKLADTFGIEQDALIRHHVVELYSSGLDKMAEEVLLTVTDHPAVGSELLTIAGQRLSHFIFVCDPSGCAEKLSKCPPTVSTWLKTLDSTHLRCPDLSLGVTATLLGHVVNQLPEGQPEYRLALELIELVHMLM